MDDVLVKILVQSPVALAILVFGWLAQRAWFPFALARWREFLADRTLERNHRALDGRETRRLAERQARATEHLSRSLDRLVSRVDANSGNGRHADTRKVKQAHDTDEVVERDEDDTSEVMRRKS